MDIHTDYSKLANISRNAKLSAMSVSCVKACGCCSAKGLLTAQHLLICFVSDAKVIRRYAKTRLNSKTFQYHHIL